ncbi:hypothetical protein [Nocardia africana]|uniref:Uncharacterized protein n=1 Tax=Nocardia africana TaxID=134964 RepID=A0A378WZ81_9NOCA|nr:hypothetical protein [Nocardia africana]MCC3312488.1 hypothetical protein [Nocardia africana]SUA46192.1 Uncharacterised protein [Nocardia africana]
MPGAAELPVGVIGCGMSGPLNQHAGGGIPFLVIEKNRAQPLFRLIGQWRSIRAPDPDEYEID